MRRQDQVGHAHISNINALQVLSGSSTNILIQPPDKYTYIKANTSIEYQWRKSFEFDFRLHYDIQLPTKATYTKDISIMDHIQTLDKYNESQINSINNCRLYYKIIYVGDMSEHTPRIFDRTTSHMAKGARYAMILLRISHPLQFGSGKYGWSIY
jgi:hypothetical protein